MSAGLYKRYLLGLLLVVYGFNQVDQLAMGLVLQNIKADLALSDTRLGLLTGIAFALFYSVMGIPIARWADRGNRVGIIAASTALWSVMVVRSMLRVFPAPVVFFRLCCLCPWVILQLMPLS